MGSEFLGRVTFEGQSILEQLTDGEAKDFELVGMEGKATKKQKGTISLSLQHKKQMRIVVAEVRKMVDPSSIEPAEQQTNGGMWSEAAAQAASTSTMSKVSCKVSWKGQLLGTAEEVETTGSNAAWQEKATFVFPYLEA